MLAKNNKQADFPFIMAMHKIAFEGVPAAQMFEMII